MSRQISSPLGVSPSSSTRILSGAPKPEQIKLLKAVQSGTLPPVAQRFMLHLHAGTTATGQAKNMARVAVSQVPPRLAEQLTALQTAAGVRAFAATLLQANPAGGQQTLTGLSTRAAISPAVAAQMTAALSKGEAGRVSLIGILGTLPAEVAQSILDARQAAMEAFFAAWTEDLAENARLDAAAAKRNAELRAQTERTNRSNANHAHNAATADRVRVGAAKRAGRATLLARRLDPLDSNFPQLLLTQRQAVLTKTRARAGVPAAGSAAAATPSLVEGSLAVTDRAGEPYSRALLAPEFNVATLYALDAPADDLGPRLGPNQPRRG